MICKKGRRSPRARLTRTSKREESRLINRMESLLLAGDYEGYLRLERRKAHGKREKAHRRRD